MAEPGILSRTLKRASRSNPMIQGSWMLGNQKSWWVKTHVGLCPPISVCSPFTVLRVTEEVAEPGPVVLGEYAKTVDRWWSPCPLGLVGSGGRALCIGPANPLVPVLRSVWGSAPGSCGLCGLVPRRGSRGRCIAAWSSVALLVGPGGRPLLCRLPSWIRPAILETLDHSKASAWLPICFGQGLVERL